VTEQVKCTGGDHPTTAAGVTLCHKCATDLTEDLKHAAFLWGDIQTSCARLDVGAASVGSSGYKEAQLAVNLDALDKAQTLRVVLSGWASHLPQLHPVGDPVRTALWLITQIGEIRRQDWAGDFKHELRAAINACRRATDRAGELVFAGMCPTEKDNGQECGTAVFTRPGRPMANCPACKSAWDVSEWRGRALDYAGVHEGTPAELSRMLSDPVTGEALPQGTIRQWVRRGKLTPIGTNGDGKSVYQVRKVRNLWARMKASPFGKPSLKKPIEIAA